MLGLASFILRSGRRRALVLGPILALAALDGASAAETLEFGPPATWIQATEPAKATPDPAAAIRILSTDQQGHVEEGGIDRYFASRIQALTAQGLQALGNVQIDWSPDTDTVVVHRLRILRGDKTIDLLANGHPFTILRRENNLEMAMLDGRLTAAAQPEGLQVGDTLDFAYTLKHKDPVLKGHVQELISFAASQPMDQARLRMSWPAQHAVRWRQTEGLPAAHQDQTGAETRIALDMTDLKPPRTPKGAPARYAAVNQFEFTDFKSWADVAALMAPLYQTASAIAPGSPLAQEVATIKASTTDPKARASAALRLVEDKVRYLYIGMNSGNYLPASAETTWSRRFADCKGKTALLLGVLRALDIEAEPAVVSTSFGDGLDQRLPSLIFFDHILVRARIGGRVYWLDGTRLGDRDIDSLQPLAYRWALPIRASGSALEALPLPPLDKPSRSDLIRLDASAGFDTPAKAHLETVIRGDAAIGLKLALEALAPAEAERKLHEYWRGLHDWADVDKVSFSYDPATGEERVTMDGAARMLWRKGGDGDQSYRLDFSLGWTPDYRRDPGPHQDAPFAVPYPAYADGREIVVLPTDSRQPDGRWTGVDKTLAGVKILETYSLVNGVFTADWSQKALVMEVSAEEALKAETDLRELSQQAWLLTVSKPRQSAAMTEEGKAYSDLVAKLQAAYKARDVLAAASATQAMFERWPNAMAAVDPAIITALVGRIATDPRGDRGYGLMHAMFKAGYRPVVNGRRVDTIWSRLAAMELEAGKLDDAKAEIREVQTSSTIISMRTDRRFDPALAPDPGRYDPVQAAEATLVADRAWMTGHPESLDIARAVAVDLLTLGRNEEALAFVDQTIARAKTPGAFTDLKGLGWVHDARHRALAALGRTDDAVAAARDAVAASAGSDRVNLPLNLAEMLCLTGRPAEVKAILDPVPNEKINQYGMMVLTKIKACAAWQLKDKAALDAALAYLEEHATEDPTNLMDALLIKGDVDRASAVTIERLKDPTTRAKMLAVLQDYKLARPVSPLDATMDARLREIRQRPEVRAELDKVGRAESWALAR